MSAKKHAHPLPRYVSEYKRSGVVRYKYQRRVPQELHDVLGRRIWDLSLGTDLSEAVSRALAFKVEHDNLINALKAPEGRQAYERKLDSEFAAELAELSLMYEDAPQLAFDGKNITFDFDVSSAHGVKLDGEKDDQELWRTTEDAIARADTMPNRQARDHLALFAAYAFADNTHLDALDADDAFGKKLVELLTPQRPSDLAGAAVFDALKGVLDTRIYELNGSTGASNSYGLGQLREAYFKLRGLSPSTKRGYITKTDSLITFAGGDLPLTEYSPTILRQWRDSLQSAGLSARSVAAYFHAVKTIMKWALKDDLVPGFAALPTDKVTLPRADDSIESIRWVRFDDDEIKRVWALLKDGWGPGSRFSETRRDSFKMIFRVLLYTGLRPVEVFRLRPEDVTKDLVHASRVKTKIPRTIPLSKHIADFHTFMQRTPFPFAEFGKPESGAETMSESFSKIIRAGGFTNDRHVLYSTKDTLVDRLQRAGASDDVIRGFTGHVSGQGKLRHYKTRLNDSPEGLLILRNAIDAIEYF